MKPKIIPYHPELKERSRELRKNSTLSEVLLWNNLKSKKMRGYTFNRQKPLGNFIVDFYCKALNLVIEIDGISHNNNYDADIKRQKTLESYGLFVLRFNDLDVKKDIENVLSSIDGWIKEAEKHPPNPLQKGELR